MLGHPLTEEEIVSCINSGNGGNKTSLEEFTAWWNGSSLNPHLASMREHRTATHESIEGTGAMFG